MPSELPPGLEPEERELWHEFNCGTWCGDPAPAVVAALTSLSDTREQLAAKDAELREYCNALERKEAVLLEAICRVIPKLEAENERILRGDWTADEYAGLAFSSTHPFPAPLDRLRELEAENERLRAALACVRAAIQEHTFGDVYLRLMAALEESDATI